MAATVNIRPTTTIGTWMQHQKTYVLKKTINFATTGYSLAQNETMAIFDIPADSVFIQAAIKVTTANTDVTDVDLGVSTTGATNDTLIDGATLATTGYKNAGTNSAIPVYNAAATQLVLTNKDADALSAGVIEVSVTLIDLTGNVST